MKKQYQRSAQAEALLRTNAILSKSAATAGAALARAEKEARRVTKTKAKKVGKKQARARVGKVGAPASIKGSQGIRAAHTRGGLVGSPYHDYLETLSRPFDVANVFCPVSYNPAPSFIQTRARTTHTNLSLTVALGSTTQLALFPGHIPGRSTMTAAQVAAAGVMASMDATSYHQVPLLVNAIPYSVGPIETSIGSTYPPIIGVKSVNVGAGTAQNTTSGSANYTPLTYDVPLPYVGNGTQTGHSRWQLVSMGIRVQNITNDLYRGGTVVSVQPNVSSHFTDGDSQALFERFPTFHDWGRGDGVELAWIPRTQDLAFWHTSLPGSAEILENTLDGSGIIVWLNAPADYPQQFSYEIVCNWQLAGQYLNTVGGPSPHHPMLKAPIEQTVSALLNSAPTAVMAKQIGVAALQATGLNSTNLSSSLAGAAATAVKMAVAGFSNV